MKSLITLATILTLCSSAFSQTCYFPNKGVSGADTACNPNSLVSACCFTGQACLSNGLCVSDPTNGTAARFHRGTCTDQNWKSGNCPRECLDVSGNGAPVYSCNITTSDKYCCGDGCSCDGGFETFESNESPADVFTVTIIGNTSFTQTHTSTPSSTATATSSSAGPTTAAASSAPSATASGTGGSSGSSSGVAIGVGVGVGVGAAVAIAAAAFWFWRRKTRNGNAYGGQKPVELGNTEYYPRPSKQTYAYFSEGVDARSPPPLPQAHQMHEMATDQAPVELPTSPGLRK